MGMYAIFGYNFAKMAGKWAWPPRSPPMVWGLQTQPKSWPTEWNFWANRYLEIMFSKFSGGEPPLNLTSYHCTVCP